MAKKRKKQKPYLAAVIAFAAALGVTALLFARFGAGGYITMGAVSVLSALIAWKLSSPSHASARSEQKEAVNVAGTKRASERIGGGQGKAQERPKAEKKSYGEKVDPILEEGSQALAEMGKLYSTITDKEIRMKINEIMLITDKIMQDAIEDPSDIPQIKKFFRYYLPTTIKLLHAYDRMSSQGIEGENIDKSISNISEMLDVAIAAYKKRLDSLFENQALDIETDIDVMNQMLAREGLTGDKDFHVQPAAEEAVQQGGAVMAQQKG